MAEVRLSKKAKSLKPGIYEHYKKKRYQVLGVVVYSETLEQLVLYKALYGKHLAWVRPLNMFLDKVKVAGKEQPRFRLIESF